MRLLMTGVTGAAGIQMYRTAILDQSVSKITVLSRRALPEWMVLPQNDKTEVVVLKDFLDYPENLLPRLADHDACIWALGKSAAGMSEAQYTEITYDYVMTAIKALEKGGVGKSTAEDGSARPPFRFVFVSGEGADQTEKSMMLFARIKGRTEKQLLELPQSSNIKATIIRPAYFFPTKADSNHVRSGTGRAFDVIATPFFSKCLPSMYTNVEGMGKVVLELAKGRWENESLVRASRMNEMMKEI